MTSTSEQLPLLRQASAEDLPVVFALLNDAAEWLASRGIDQWPAKFERDNEWRAQRIEKYVANGYVYIASDDRGYVATVTISPHADPDFAGGWPDGPDNALYVYRMATMRRAAGQGLGERMLAWAGDRAARSGRPWLRLDVHRDNHELQRYYERLGFIRVATVVKPPRGSGALYQRPARIEPVTLVVE
ncbi:GNAT family N-acetyltransferase [Actinopolymorpha singaporensis]|uniref:Acetyltransferase (GNAT) family protein n=1 Tax=Actinopolymorpha singaporensis TaxID=117157 RepID=A0A1H1TA28_9ACTN|nr:GNAT family N-acetyltransferase [Actinopolymorpha singaporensis]SDS57145.1 Acetyltransferase (GNAT) family protein [Actinopolymorpha singaporensis]